MNTTKPVLQLIKARVSCRTYDPQPIPPAILSEFSSWITAMNAQTKSQIRFVLMTSLEQSDQKPVKLGSYGILSGAHTYLVLISHATKGNALELGYLGEKIVLKAADLDLGTVWLGGTFNRADFQKNAKLGPDEEIALVIPVGIAKARRSLIDSAMRLGAGSANRKPWETLFFNKTVDTPLSREEAGRYAEVLDMVRLGPSASNKQPWRIVKDGLRFHLYLERTPGYSRMMSYDLQLNDIGIAQCHFELSAAELDLKGSWILEDPHLSDTWTYCMTWLIQN